MSWKKFGGIRQFDTFNNLNVNSIATDEITIREAYKGTFTICGELFVDEDSFLSGNTSIEKSLMVDNDIYAKNSIIIGTNNTEKTITTNTNGLGINVENPTALLDLSGSADHLINVYSNSSSITTTLLRNPTSHSIVSLDNSGALIDFSIQGNHVSFAYDNETSLMTFNKDISFSDSIYGGGNLTINNYGYIGNDFTVLGNVDLRQDVSMNGSLNVSKTVTINENVTIGNDAMIHGNIETLGDLTVRGKLDFEGDISFNGNLLSGGKGVFNSFMSIGGNLTVNDDTTIGGNVIAHGDIRSSGMIELSGNVMIHGNHGIFIDGLKTNDAIIRPWDLNNDTTSTGFDVLENALYLNTPIVIGGNLYIDGSANLVGTITQQIGANSGLGVTIEEGYLEDLSGTNLKELYVNYKQVDVSNSGLKGAGLFIYNRPDYNTDGKNFDLNDDGINDGFMKVSSENEDRISFRSVGSKNVVSIDLPNMVTNNTAENSIVVLKYNDNALNNETDNYIVSSSHIETNGIYVKNSLYDINDIVVENDASVHGNIIVTKNTTGESLNMETIFGNVATIEEMTVTGNAMFENTVNVGNWLTISNEVMYFNSGNLFLPFTDDNNDIIHKNVVTVIQSISTSITNNVIAPELDNIFTGDLNNFTKSVSIHNNLIIGDSTIGAATVDNIPYNLSCIGDVSFSGNLFVDNIVVNETIAVIQDISLNGNLYGPYIEIQDGNVLNLVAGNTVSNYMDVLQDISINGTLYSNNSAVFNNSSSDYLTVGTKLESLTLLEATDVSVNGSLNTQQIFASDTIHAYKDISLNGNLYANQHAIVNILDVSNTATITGNLISETFFNAADVQVDGSLNTQQIFALDNIHAYKDISLNGTLYANQNAIVNILNVLSTATVTGDLISETLFKASEVEISQDTSTNDVHVHGELNLYKNMDLNTGNVIFRYDNNSYSISPEVFYHLKDVSQNIQEFFIQFETLISQIDVFRGADNQFTGDNTFIGTTTMTGDTNITGDATITGKLIADTFDITNQLEVRGYLENDRDHVNGGANDYTYCQKHSNGIIKTLSNIECKGETYYKYTFLASEDNYNHYDSDTTRYYTADGLFSSKTIDEISANATSVETVIEGGKIECRELEVDTTTTLNGATTINADATFAENTETRVNGTLRLPSGAVFQVDDRTYNTSSLKTVLDAGSGEVDVRYSGDTTFSSLLTAEKDFRLKGNLILEDIDYTITQDELESLQGLTGNIQAQINTLDAKTTFSTLTVNGSSSLHGDVEMKQDVTIDGYLQSHDNVYLYQTHNDISGVYKFKSYDVSSIALFSKTAYMDNSDNIYSQLDNRLLGTTTLTGTIEEITHFEQNSINVTFVRSGTDFQIFHDLNNSPFTGDVLGIPNNRDYNCVHLISIEDTSLNIIYRRDSNHRFFILPVDLTMTDGDFNYDDNTFNNKDGVVVDGIITKHVDSDELAFFIYRIATNDINTYPIYTSFDNLYNDISFELTNVPSTIEVGNTANFIVGTDLNGDHFFVTMQTEYVYYNDSEVIVTRYGNDPNFSYIQLTENKDMLSILDVTGEATKLYKFNYGSPSTFLYDINLSSNYTLYLTRNSLAHLASDTSLNYYHIFYGFYDNSYNVDYSTTEKVHTTIQDHNGPLPHKDSVQGSLTIQHTQKGGSSSIVFPNSSRAGEFASIQYVESNKTVDSQHLLYDPLSSKENSVLFIGTKQVSDETQDNIVIRGGGTVVLDAGKYVSEDICGILQTAVKPLEKMDYGTVHLQPRGGTVVVGGDGSNTTTDNALDVSGNVYLRNDVTIDGSANIGGDLYVTNNIVRESLHIGSDTISSDNALDVSGDVYLRNTITIDGATMVVGDASVYSTTASNSSSSGALVVSGGVGIGGNINVAQNIVMENGTLTITEIGDGSAGSENENAVGTITLKHTAEQTGCNSIVFQSAKNTTDNARIVFYDDLIVQTRDDLSYGFITATNNNRSCLLIQNNNSGASNNNTDNIIIRSQGHLVLDTGNSAALRTSDSGTPGDIYALPNGGSFIIGSDVTSTSYALDVSGDAYLRNDVTIDGTVSMFGDVNVNTTSNVTIHDATLYAQGTSTVFGNLTSFPANVISNTAFGLHALNGAASPANTAVGSNALSSGLSGGGMNTAIGNGSSVMLANSQKNVSIGHNSFPDATDDSDLNTVIGVDTFQKITSNSSRNTCIGSSIGGNFNNGSYNSFFGSGTNVSDANSSYSYSTALGYGAMIDASNQIVLGRNTEYVYIPSTTPSTGTSDGALVVGGGVGIGGSLNVVGDVSANSYKAANTAGMRYTFEGDETTGIYYNSSNSFSFYTDNTERLQLQSGTDVAIPGQLAIGQTSASSTLDVSGAINCKGESYGSATSGSLMFEHGANNASSIIFKNTASNTDYGFIRYVDSYSDFASIDTSFNIRYSDVSSSIFGTGNGASVLYIGTETHESDSFRDNMLIRPSGVLTLDTGGSTSATDNNNIILFPNSDASGKVGIKNADPSYDLDVSGTFRCTDDAHIGSTLYFDMWDNFSNTDYYHTIYDASGNDRIAFYGEHSGNHSGSSYYYGESHHFRTSSSGAIVKADSFDAETNYTFNGDDDTGINYISSDSFSLNASGRQILGINTTNNVYFGDYALYNQNSTYSTAIGNNALKNTTGCTDNTAIGYDAGTSTSGNYNTLIGTSTITGSYSYCTVIGYNATATKSNQVVLGRSNEDVYIPGRLGIKDSTPSYDLDITGTFRCTSGATAASFNATSDYRVKENVQTISGENYIVDHLRPVSYTLKDSQEPHVGFIAHELQEHVPTAVKGEKDGEEMQSVNYSELIPILVKEIQDLKARIKVLENKN